MIKWLDKFGDPEWRKAHRFWSVQLSVFWGLLSGIWAALPAFQVLIPPVHFVVLCAAIAILVAVARVTNQPGLDND